MLGFSVQGFSLHRESIKAYSSLLGNVKSRNSCVPPLEMNFFTSQTIIIRWKVLVSTSDVLGLTGCCGLRNLFPCGRQRLHCVSVTVYLEHFGFHTFFHVKILELKISPKVCLSSSPICFQQRLPFRRISQPQHLVLKGILLWSVEVPCWVLSSLRRTET